MTLPKLSPKRGKRFDGLMVKTLSCGLKDPGSIPGRGIKIFYFSLETMKKITQQTMYILSLKDLY